MAANGISSWVLKRRKKSAISGFSLIELVVVLAILVILFAGALFMINPLGQITKAKDSRRQHDFSQIKNGLDTYYNDASCYPTQIPFGWPWSSGNKNTYLNQVPEDPDCSETSPLSCYIYETDFTGNCPQWAVVFGKLQNTSGKQNSCPLESLSNCLPKDYKSQGYNFCLVTGNVDCNYLSSGSMPLPIVPSPTPTSAPIVNTPTSPPTDTPVPGRSPTPTPNNPPGCQKNYSCTGSPTTRCNVAQVLGAGQYCSRICDGNCP